MLEKAQELHKIPHPIVYKINAVNCWQSCITFQLLALLEAVLPKWMAFDLPSNRTKHYNHHQFIHCFKIDTDYNGNSFWRTSRFRESQASSMSFLEAELQIEKKQKGWNLNNLRFEWHISSEYIPSIRITTSIPQRNSQILPGIICLGIHSECTDIVTNRFLIHTLYSENRYTFLID